MKIVVGHLYPDYLNIYADRGNIAVLERRAAWRGHELEVQPVSAEDALEPGAHDLLYIGGGQDREQALVAHDLQGKRDALLAAAEGGAAVLAVCGGYQLLGRFYRFGNGDELPGVGLFPLHTIAGERRMIGDILLDAELTPGERRTIAGFENHAGRTYLDEGAEPLGRVVAGFGNDGESGARGVPRRPRDRDVPPRPAASAQPVARRLAARPGDRAPHRRRGAGLRAAPRRAGAGRPRRVRAACARPRRPLLGHPDRARGRRPGRPASSAAGSAGSAGGGRCRRGRRRAKSRWPRTAASCDVTCSSERPVRSPEKMMCTTCFAAKLRSGAIESAIAIGPSSGSSSSIPTSSSSSRWRASARLSPASTPPPGSSQYSLPGFSCRQRRMRSSHRSSADTRIRGCIRPTSRTRGRRARCRAALRPRPVPPRERRARRAARSASRARPRTARGGRCSAG